MMKERLQVYISPEADVLLRKMAAANMRSISATVEMLIVNAASTADNKNEKSRHAD
jgi:hypothetical protein